MIYLDHNASTPCDPRVVDAMLPWFTERAANASSVDHRPGNAALAAVERARGHVAALVAANPEDVVFTSGATEADNLAVLGTLARAPVGAEIVVSAVEHPAVLEPARRWRHRVRVVPVDADGVVEPAAVAKAISPHSALVSVMAANNETGAIQPTDAIGAICREHGVPFHVDAAQAAGRVPADVGSWQASLISLSAHKMHGPMGVGALVIRRIPTRARIAALVAGGGHERALRPGTLNVPGIVGFGEAARIAKAERSADAERWAAQKEMLLEALRTAHPALRVNGPTERALPQTLNVSLPGVNARALIRLVADELAIATGSACSTTSIEPSHVLLAMGRTPRESAESVRISFGRATSTEDLVRAAAAVAAAVPSLLALADIA